MCELGLGVRHGPCVSSRRMGLSDRIRGTSPPEWRADPTGKHQYRWWDGRGWTDQVATNGVTSTEIADDRLGYAVTVTAGRFDDLAETVDFDALPFDYRGFDATPTAYGEPERFARAVRTPRPCPPRASACGRYREKATVGTTLPPSLAPRASDGVWVRACRPSCGRSPTTPMTPTPLLYLSTGRLVGYLLRREVATHRRLIDRAIAQHGRATCGAVINGGWDRPRGEGSCPKASTGYGSTSGTQGGRVEHGEDLPDPAVDEERIPLPE